MFDDYFLYEVISTETLLEQLYRVWNLYPRASIQKLLRTKYVAIQVRQRHLPMRQSALKPSRRSFTEYGLGSPGLTYGPDPAALRNV
jgi:hypothetical protein